MTETAPPSIPPTVEDDEPLHRVLNPKCGAIQEGRVHYMAFFSSRPPWVASVDRALYRTAEETLVVWPGCGIGKLFAGEVRALDVAPLRSLEVHARGEEDNPAHAEIEADPDAGRKKFKNKVCMKLADISSIVRFY